MEQVFSIALLSFVLLELSSFIFNIALVNKVFSKNDDMFESGRIASEMLHTQIQYSSGIKITTNTISCLYPDDHKFEFDKVRKTLKFGGQELTKNIANMQSKCTGDILFVSIKTLDDCEFNRIISIKRHPLS